MVPSVGRVVHYVAHGTPVREDGTQAFPAVCRAAIVTEVGPETESASVAVLNPTGVFFGRWLEHDEGKGSGTWHWPERTE